MAASWLPRINTPEISQGPKTDSVAILSSRRDSHDKSNEAGSGGVNDRPNSPDENKNPQSKAWQDEEQAQGFGCICAADVASNAASGIKNAAMVCVFQRRKHTAGRAGTRSGVFDETFDLLARDSLSPSPQSVLGGHGSRNQRAFDFDERGCVLTGWKPRIDSLARVTS